MAVHRAVAVVFDVGPDQCGAVELSIEDGNGEQVARIIQGRAVCDGQPAVVWLGQVGLCASHTLQLWPELAGSPELADP